MNTRSKYRPRCCNECGATYTPRRADELFCAVPCRKAFDNRAMARGRDLYHLFMALRYERGLAKARGIWGIVCMMGRKWREEDERERGGRKSWASYKTVLDRALSPNDRATSFGLVDLPSVNTAVIQDKTGRRGAKR